MDDDTDGDAARDLDTDGETAPALDDDTDGDAARDLETDGETAPALDDDTDGDARDADADFDLDADARETLTVREGVVEPDARDALTEREREPERDDDGDSEVCAVTAAARMASSRRHLRAAAAARLSGRADAVIARRVTHTVGARTKEAGGNSANAKGAGWRRNAWLAQRQPHATRKRGEGVLVCIYPPAENRVCGRRAQPPPALPRRRPPRQCALRALNVPDFLAIILSRAPFSFSPKRAPRVARFGVER